MPVDAAVAGFDPVDLDDFHSVARCGIGAGVRLDRSLTREEPEDLALGRRCADRAIDDHADLGQPAADFLRQPDDPLRVVGLQRLAVGMRFGDGVASLSGPRQRRHRGGV